MNLEAFYRVLPLLVETCGRLFLPLEKSSSSINSFLGKKKEALCCSKRIDLGWLPCSPKNLCYLTPVCMPLYRKRVPGHNLPVTHLIRSSMRSRTPLGWCTNCPNPAPTPAPPIGSKRSNRSAIRVQLGLTMCACLGAHATPMVWPRRTLGHPQ